MSYKDKLTYDQVSDRLYAENLPSDRGTVASAFKTLNKQLERILLGKKIDFKAGD